MMWKTKAAQTVYFASGKLSHIRTPQQTYLISNLDTVFSEGENPRVEKRERRWLPCRLSHKLLSWSMSLDPVHWDHWALVHKGCGASYCMDCKGYSCGEDGHN